MSVTDTEFMHIPFVEDPSSLIVVEDSIAGGSLGEAQFVLSHLPNKSGFRLAVKPHAGATPSRYTCEFANFALAWLMATLVEDPAKEVQRCADALMGFLPPGLEETLGEAAWKEIDRRKKALRKALFGLTPDKKTISVAQVLPPDSPPDQEEDDA